MASTTELKALEDISALLTTGMFSDVTLVVGEKTAAAHKNILAARSPVFVALFAELSHAENRVEVDIQADVLDHFLAFIYTGVVPALEPKMARDLLAAAEKYQVEQLKSITEDYLNRFISPSTTARPLPPIERLHDPCLVALFRQLPPADKITARTVCHRWADLVPYAARSTRSLAILVNQSLGEAEDQFNFLSHGSDWKLLKLLQKEDDTPLLPMHSLSQWNSLQFRTLDEATVTAIMATFPALKELLFCTELYNGNLFENNCNCFTTTTPPLSFLDHLVCLLEHWRPQLTTLKLSVLYTFESVTSCARLGAAISSLSALKHLDFRLDWNHLSHCPPLSNLPQLIHFTAYSNPHQYAAMLRQYVSLNPPPVQINLYCGYNEWRSIIAGLTSLNEDLRRRIRRIDFGHFSWPTDYRTVCHHFPSLTSANFRLSEDTTFRDLLTHVSQLTQLIFLQLHINFSAIHPDDQPQHLLPQLKSIKLLQLKISNLNSYSDLEPLNIPWTMPNLQVIDFLTIAFRSSSDEQQKQCLRQIFAPLKRGCAKLHTIKHNYEEWLGTAEEILAEPIIEAAPSVNSSNEQQSTPPATKASRRRSLPREEEPRVLRQSKRVRRQPQRLQY